MEEDVNGLQKCLFATFVADDGKVAKIGLKQSPFKQTEAVQNGNKLIFDGHEPVFGHFPDVCYGSVQCDFKSKKHDLSMATTFICPSIAERLKTVTKLNSVINESGDILEYMPSVVIWMLYNPFYSFKL